MTFTSHTHKVLWICVLSGNDLQICCPMNLFLIWQRKCKSLFTVFIVHETTLSVYVFMSLIIIFLCVCENDCIQRMSNKGIKKGNLEARI